jgi:hypothetical protein
LFSSFTGHVYAISSLQGKKYVLQITVLCMCPSACRPPFQLFNHLYDFYEAWYAHYTTGRYPISIPQAVITKWWTRKSVSVS